MWVGVRVVGLVVVLLKVVVILVICGSVDDVLFYFCFGDFFFCGVG